MDIGRASASVLPNTLIITRVVMPLLLIGSHSAMPWTTPITAASRILTSYPDVTVLHIYRAVTDHFDP